MRTRFVEATQDAADGFNWGKFMVGIFEPDEWSRPSEMHARTPRDPTPRDPMRPFMANPPVSLLRARGWSPAHVLVLDLETGEGAIFTPGGKPTADLDKHRVWVCPMFEPFLKWLYERVAADHEAVHPNDPPVWFDSLPTLVELPDAAPAMHGYRRPGVEADDG